jgi:hypothetical protein
MQPDGQIDAQLYAETRSRLRPCRALAWLPLTLLLGLLLAPGAFATSATDTFLTPGVHRFVVPAGVSGIEASLQGGAGGGCENSGGTGAALSATLAVTPGDELSIGVAGDGSCQFGASSSNPGGVGGGGLATERAGSGGGASTVATRDQPPGFASVLAVAAGGGGAGAGPGGDAESTGFSNGPAEGGGAGTLQAGGLGGKGFSCGEPATAGATGSAFAGGIGGRGWGPFGGGGGGGGGYFGGGGGGGVGCALAGGSGGGGSSFVDPLATNVAGPTLSSAEPFVSITYATPTAEVGANSLTFAAQPQSTMSVAQPVTVTNHGSAPLEVLSAASIGTNAADYILTSRCQTLVEPGDSCAVDVRFAPQQSGVSSASLVLETNASQQPLEVTLSGAGGELPQGLPGEAGLRGPAGIAGAAGVAGASGAQGVPGAAGATGAPSPAAARGSEGPAAALECHRSRQAGRKGRLACFVRVQAPAAPSGARAGRVRATLQRGGATYASWSGHLAGEQGELRMPAVRRLAPGAYTLTFDYPGAAGHSIRRTLQLQVG